jgi:all-trans-retinol dehydrogenase (NAD+)
VSTSYYPISLSEYSLTHGTALNQELKHVYKAPNVRTTSIHPGWARTPLIAPVEQELRRRGAAISEPSEVADAVVNSIFSCRGGQVFLPAGVSKATMLRALPNWLQENARDEFSKTVLDSIKLKS